MKLIFICLVLVALVFAQERQVDALFAAYNSPSKAGCAVGIIRGGQLIYAKGFGSANIEHRIPITADTAFDIASVSKQFTALSIALAAQDGLLSLSDPVTKYIPELKVSATIKQVVHHLAGFKDYVDLHNLKGDGLVFTPQSTIDLMSRQSTLFDAGRRFEYSNTGYFLLSVIIERATGKTMSQYAKENIFDKLGMKDTQFYNDHRKLVPNRAMPYRVKNSVYRYEQIQLDHTGDGAIITTVNDWLKYEQNWFNNKLGRQPGQLNAQLLELGRRNDGKVTDYAFGLTLDEYNGMSTIEHDGSWGGFTSEFIRFPKERFAVVIFSNDRDMKADLSLKIADLYLRDSFTKLSVNKTIHRYSRKMIEPSMLSTSITPNANEYAGFYCSEEIGTTWEILNQNGKLVLNLRNWAPVNFVVRADGRYTTDHIFTGSFKMSGGQVTSMEVTDDEIGTLVFNRLPGKPQCY